MIRDPAAALSVAGNCNLDDLRYKLIPASLTRRIEALNTVDSLPEPLPRLCTIFYSAAGLGKESDRGGI